MRFYPKDTDIYPIKGNPHMLHLATIGMGFREFVVMMCTKGKHKGKCYIEELVHTMVDYKSDIYGHFRFIDDDKLAFDLAKYADEKKYTDVASRFMEGTETGVIKVF